MSEEFVSVAAGWWAQIDRSDWPLVQGPDHVAQMVRLCPGCGIYPENDRDPSDHFCLGEPDCSWALGWLRRADYVVGPWEPEEGSEK